MLSSTQLRRLRSFLTNEGQRQFLLLHVAGQWRWRTIFRDYATFGFLILVGIRFLKIVSRIWKD